MFWTRGSVSLQRIIDLPGPREFWIIPATSTANGSGFVPWKTVHTSPRCPALMSARGRDSPWAGWAPRRQAADASRRIVRSVRPIVRFPNLRGPRILCENSEAAYGRFHHFACPVYRGTLVSRADERGLVGAGRQVDPLVEAAVEKAREQLCVARARARRPRADSRRNPDSGGRLWCGTAR